MQQGKVLAAQHQGAYVIKLIGDVRLTLCTTIDEYIESMFAAPGFVGVVIDLSEAEGIDSTSLGLLAKLAVRARQQYQMVPIILSPNPNITRLLDSMGFGKVFDICASLVMDESGTPQSFGELPEGGTNEDYVRNKIIEAHKTLMALNEENRTMFSSLVSTLESECS